MKKLIIILFVVVNIAAFSQTSENINAENIRLENRLYGMKSGSIDTLAVPDPDSTGQFIITNVRDPKNILDAVNYRTLLDFGIAQPFDSIYLDSETANIPTVKYTMFADSTNRTFSINLGNNVILQIGQENISRIFNSTGSVISNGQIVGINDSNGLLELAIATNRYDVLFMATEDIGIGQLGFVASLSGRVRGLDTSGDSVGAIYLSGSSAGEWTQVKPVFPAYLYALGSIFDVAVDGSISFSNIGADFNNTIRNYWNGSIRESFDFRVSSDGTTITGTLEKAGGGDLTLIFSDGYYTLDCTPALEITLTAGTNSIPAVNYVYIPKTTKTLTASTSDWPSGEYAAVADLVLQAADSLENNDALGNRNWNDHLAGTDLMGDNSHVGFWIRSQPATYKNGIDGTVTIVTNATTPDSVFFSNTSGKVMQKHLQSFASTDMRSGKVAYIVNNSTTAYKPITDLSSELTDSEGSTMSGRYFNITVFGINNKTGEEDQIMFNLPSGSYSSLADAVADVDSYNNDGIPLDFKGKGFLMFRYTFKHSTAGSGTWTLENTADLRNTTGSVGGGGGGGGATTLLGLTDTPASYIGAGSKFGSVNSGESVFEFVMDTTTHIATKYDIDTLSTNTAPNVYEYGLISDSENNFTIPFTIKSTSLIYFNGEALRNSLWSGEGTTTLNVGVSTKQYDYLIINKN